LVAYLIKRVALALFIMTWAALVNFVIIAILPGDHFTPYKIGIALAGLPVEETHETLVAEYGLDKPWIVQFLSWYGRAIFRGDFGYSLYLDKPIQEEFFRSGGALSNTLIISGFSMLIAWLAAIPVGIVTALRKGRFLYWAVSLVSMPTLAVPGFYLASILLVIVAKLSDPIFARASMWGLCGYEYAGCPMSWGKLMSCILHMLPLWILVGAPVFAVAVKILRSSILDTLDKRYIVTARGKGLHEIRIYFKHVLRNALNPLISTIGTSLPTVLVNAFLVSWMFGIQTYGNLVRRAVEFQDPALLGATMLFYSFVLVLGNLLADIGLAVIDPRIRYS
jgi:peptide/nickel transport system permease protein